MSEKIIAVATVATLVFVAAASAFTSAIDNMEQPKRNMRGEDPEWYKHPTYVKPARSWKIIALLVLAVASVVGSHAALSLIRA